MCVVHLFFMIYYAEIWDTDAPFSPAASSVADGLSRIFGGKPEFSIKGFPPDALNLHMNSTSNIT